LRTTFSFSSASEQKPSHREYSATHDQRRKDEQRMPRLAPVALSLSRDREVGVRPEAEQGESDYQEQGGQ
jgi:hypothetical protein